MPREVKTCKRCKKKLKFCETHKKWFCNSCSSDCVKCMDDALAQGKCPKCWEPLAKCDLHDEISVYCPRCDALPHMPKTNKPICPACWSKSSQFSVIHADCTKCKKKRVYCTSHTLTWCGCSGTTCPLCQAAIDKLRKEKKKPMCNKHKVDLVTIGIDDPDDYWCTICNEEKERSGKYKHHCGTLLAYCGSHNCYVCPQCDILSECIDDCKVGELVNYKSDGQGLHWEWQEFLEYKAEREKIYQHLLTIAKGWPNLKQAVDSYCGMMSSSQPEASENLYADASYFEDAIEGLKLAFVNLKLDEAIEFNRDDEFEENNDEENGDDIEYLEEENRYRGDDYYGSGGPYGGNSYRGDDSWGVPDRRRSKHSRKEYEESKYYVTRPPRPFCTRVTVKEVLTKGLLDEGTIVYPFVKEKEEKGEKGTIRVRDEESGFA